MPRRPLFSTSPLPDAPAPAIASARTPLAALLADAPGGPWSLHRIERERGPVRHTVRSALRGGGMRFDAIERLARLLNVPVALVRAAVEATNMPARAERGEP